METMTSSLHRLLGAAAAVLLLAGCSAPAATPGADGGTASGPASGSSPATAAAGSGESLLADYGLEGRGTEEVVAALDATHEDRERGLAASVTPEEVVLADGERQETLPVPEGRFYLAVAPFETTTHECFHHSLAGCQGELVDTPVHVTVTAADGEVLVDEERTTYANGFVGLWLPAGIEGTIAVEAKGRSATADIGTGADDPTCLTTLQLS